MMKKALVAQSGGPSPVINSSLLGVIEGCMSYNRHIQKVYAGWHGIEGVLKEELIDISRQPEGEISLLKSTPAAGAVGTCRYKLKEREQKEDFERIINVFIAHDIGYFFYIGGNDSMDTANKISRIAQEKGLELTVAGVPKTIDNDVGDAEFSIVDHTPGYGSAARYWAYVTQIVNEENLGMNVSECVSVLQAMGRKTGFITAASRLGDPERQMPLQLYMAESGHSLNTLADNVNNELKRSGRCIVIVNEGFDVGGVGEAHDGFGHVEYGASRTTAAQAVVNHLNSVGLKARGQATGQVPGVLQRCTSIFASRTDIDEAYNVGREAVRIAVQDGTGWMATIRRRPGQVYRAFYDKVRLEKVANSERFMPDSWICKNGTDVTDEFVKYAMPLIGEGWPDIRIENRLQRFARLKPEFAEKKLPPYIPVGFRGQ